MEVKGYQLPDDLYYDRNHCWGRVEGGIVTVGLNDFAQKLAKDFVSVDLPLVNGHLRILIFGHENSPCELK
ncbi:MAG: hypothetical protein ACOX13_01900 [Bacillota bacterium]